MNKAPCQNCPFYDECRAYTKQRNSHCSMGFAGFEKTFSIIQPTIQTPEDIKIWRSRLASFLQNNIN